MTDISAISPKELKKQKASTDQSINLPVVLKPPYKSHKLMGILLAHTGAIGCIGLNP